MLWGFGVIFAGIFALVGFVIWDRRTTLSPLEKRVTTVETNFENMEPDKLKKIFAVFNELAKKDTKVAQVLKQFNLL